MTRLITGSPSSVHTLRFGLRLRRFALLPPLNRRYGRNLMHKTSLTIRFDANVPSISAMKNNVSEVHRPSRMGFTNTLDPRCLGSHLDDSNLLSF